MPGSPDIRPTLDELIATVRVRTPGESALEHLGAAVAYAQDLAELADNLVGHFVALARNEGASWAQIGEVLGVSKQGAQQRFVPRGPLNAADFENKDLFGRFTNRARQIVLNAEQHARRLRHSYVGTEHLLLELIDESDGIAAKALESLDTSLDAVRQAVEQQVVPGSGSPDKHIPFGPRAKTILELTLREALKLGHNYIGTEHIALALVTEPEGLGGVVLRELGVDYEQLREKEIELLVELSARRRDAG